MGPLTAVLAWMLGYVGDPGIHLFMGSDEAAAVAAQQYDRLECQVVRESSQGPWRDWSVWEFPYDCPERIELALAAVADREGPGNFNPTRVWVGRHERDAWAERQLHRKGLRRGILDARCPAHWGPSGMSTLSTWGLMYVYNVHRLHAPANCVPWQLFAFSSVAAKAAASHYVEMCNPDRMTQWSWCPSVTAQKRSRRRRLIESNRNRSKHET